MHGASVTEQVTAWSTLAAVVVALGVSVGPLVWRWWTRPRLELSVGMEEPYRLPEWEEQSLFLKGSSLRLRVKNVGRGRQAENVRAQVQTVWAYGVTPRPWAQMAVDITPRLWSSRRFQGELIMSPRSSRWAPSVQVRVPDPAARTAAEVAVIPIRLSDYVEFAYWDRRIRQVTMRDLYPGERRALDVSHASMALRFQLAITVDGIKPVVKVVSVVALAELRAIEFADAPRPEWVDIAGLFNIVAKAVM